MRKEEKAKLFSTVHTSGYKLTLPHPDGFIATAVLCLQDGGVDSVGGLRLDA